MANSHREMDPQTEEKTYNDSNTLEDDDEIVLIETPVLYHTNQSCSQFPIGLNDYSAPFDPDIPELVFEPEYFHYTNGELCKNETETGNVIDLSIKTESHQNCSASNINTTETDPDTKSESDDDIIFIKEYKNEQTVVNELTFQEKFKNSDSNIRRNPIRTVRNKSKNLSHELFYEEDFVFFDTTDDDTEEKENKAVKKSPAAKLPKEWPVNVHERPEYNPETKKIEAFDYTIREIQNTSGNSEPSEMPKKTKKDQAPARNGARKKPRVRRSRKQASPWASPVAVRETVSLDPLKPLINSTTDMLKQYFISTRENQDIIKTISPLCTFENKVEILRNQAFLFAIVNNLDEREVTDKFKHLDLNNKRKS
uniref:Uncharacterized protein LOC114335268 isoform X1 n=1 Tax=Diabrotica virgifera virgifera TaxID=50390 RepID=A0A6P7FXT7_DIAVI